MKKILTVAALMMVMLLPAFAQGQRMSTEDQGKFDSYYSRWQQYRQSNDRDQVSSMEKRMQDLMGRYNIPSNVPFDRIASGGGGYNNGYNNNGYNNNSGQYGDRDRYQDRDRDGDRDRDRDNRVRRDQWRGRLSGDDQRRFNSYYSRWRSYQRSNNHEQMESMEKRMREVMDRNNVPQDVPYDAVANRRR